MKREVEVRQSERGFSIIAYYNDEEAKKRQMSHKANAMSISVRHDSQYKRYVLTAQEVIAGEYTLQTIPMADSSNWNYLAVDGSRMNRKKIEKVEKIFKDNIEELVKLMVGSQYLALAEKTVELTEEV